MLFFVVGHKSRNTRIYLRNPLLKAAIALTTIVNRCGAIRDYDSRKDLLKLTKVVAADQMYCNNIELHKGQRLVVHNCATSMIVTVGQRLSGY